jgi:hypothetical protein
LLEEFGCAMVDGDHQSDKSDRTDSRVIARFVDFPNTRIARSLAERLKSGYRCTRLAGPCGGAVLAPLDLFRDCPLDAGGDSMRTGTRWSAAIIGIALSVADASLGAHHSFAAEYDEHKTITLKGTLTRVDWVNPHGWLYMDVKGPDGTVVNWAIEAGGPNALLRRGLRKTDFPAGIEIVVTGFLAKNGSPTANGRTVTLPDGRDFFAGSSGTGAPSDGAER